MNHQCVSIRSKATPGERCTARAAAGSEWCGRHRTSQVRFVPVAAAAPDTIEHAVPSPPRREGQNPWTPPPREVAVASSTRIFRAWRRWLARRAGPLLWAREESNNPFDFFSADPVAEIPLREFVSFVDAGKGYCMDIKSAQSLLEHAAKSGEVPLNPFNRAPLPAAFLRRVALHTVGTKKPLGWTALAPQTEAQAASLAATDVFRTIEDLGYYTDPQWFMDLGRAALQCFYIELADIWHHRASLHPTDRNRIVPPAAGMPFQIPVATALVMQQRALRPLLLKACQLLVSAASARADKQLGVSYVLGALTLVSPGAATAYPWLLEAFSPGATRIVGGQVVAVHPSVLLY